jgi:predicted nucleic acid-binding Zn ribbon protein
MTEKILQHAHCPVCGKAMPSDEKTCSEACMLRYNAMVKKRKFWLYAFYAMLIVFIVMMLTGGG